MTAPVADPPETLVRAVHTLTRPPTWRTEPLRLSYLFTLDETGPDQMSSLYSWALAQGYPNPRVITPRYQAWAQLFNPRFHRAATLSGLSPEQQGSRVLGHLPELVDDDALTRFWLQSVVFLASVTMSAAIVQSRWGPGTIASKYDRLWQAGQFGEAGLDPRLEALGLPDSVRHLAADTELPPLDRLLAVRGLFEQVIEVLTADQDATRKTLRASRPPAELAGRFGFVSALRERLEPDLLCVVAYGSSVTSPTYADIDLVLVTADPRRTLQKLAGTSPDWHGKELNVSVYSPDELWAMQLLSGDNLHSYGLCLYGEVDVPDKPRDLLLARNFSFGMVRQRQQLGMVGAAMTFERADAEDDRRSLHEYFVKIPSNVVKGTWGADGRQMSKDVVNEWLRARCGFETVAQQRAVTTGPPGPPLAAAAVATGAAMAILNEELDVVQTRKQASIDRDG